ncbi:hypothetical protein GEMRC1_005404 [Eukaryota sp. GEM-RC1]
MKKKGSGAASPDPVYLDPTTVTDIDRINGLVLLPSSVNVYTNIPSLLEPKDLLPLPAFCTFFSQWFQSLTRTFSLTPPLDTSLASEIHQSLVILSSTLPRLLNCPSRSDVDFDLLRTSFESIDPKLMTFTIEFLTDYLFHHFHLVKASCLSKTLSDPLRQSILIPSVPVLNPLNLATHTLEPLDKLGDVCTKEHEVVIRKHIKDLFSTLKDSTINEITSKIKNLGLELKEVNV